MLEVLCLRIKSASFEVSVGMSRDCTSWDGTFGDRSARLATTEDARELRVERRDEYIGIGAIARSSLECEDTTTCLRVGLRLRRCAWLFSC
jgi:hypothetical protein